MAHAMLLNQTRSNAIVGSSFRLFRSFRSFRASPLVCRGFPEAAKKVKFFILIEKLCVSVISNDQIMIQAIHIGPNSFFFFPGPLPINLRQALDWAQPLSPHPETTPRSLAPPFGSRSINEIRQST